MPLLHARVNDVVLPAAQNYIAVRAVDIAAPEHFLSGVTRLVVEDGRHVMQFSSAVQRRVHVEGLYRAGNFQEILGSSIRTQFAVILHLPDRDVSQRLSSAEHLLCLKQALPINIKRSIRSHH